jgi:hypothetical protein
VPDFYSGATGPSGRFTEGFSLRRLHTLSFGPDFSAPRCLADEVLPGLLRNWTIRQALGTVARAHRCFDELSTREAKSLALLQE